MTIIKDEKGVATLALSSKISNFNWHPPGTGVVISKRGWYPLTPLTPPDKGGDKMEYSV